MNEEVIAGATASAELHVFIAQFVLRRDRAAGAIGCQALAVATADIVGGSARAAVLRQLAGVLSAPAMRRLSSVRAGLTSVREGLTS